MMWSEVPIFWDYITWGEDGAVNGVRDDSPEEMKKAYKEWAKREEEMKKIGIKIDKKDTHLSAFFIA